MDTVALQWVPIVQPANVICHMLLYIRLNFPGIYYSEWCGRKFLSCLLVTPLFPQCRPTVLYCQAHDPKTLEHEAVAH